MLTPFNVIFAVTPDATAIRSVVVVVPGFAMPIVYVPSVVMVSTSSGYNQPPAVPVMTRSGGVITAVTTTVSAELAEETV